MEYRREALLGFLSGEQTVLVQNAADYGRLRRVLEAAGFGGAFPDAGYGDAVGEAAKGAGPIWDGRSLRARFSDGAVSFAPYGVSPDGSSVSAGDWLEGKPLPVRDVDPSVPWYL